MEFGGIKTSGIAGLCLLALAACGANETILEGERIAIRPQPEETPPSQDAPPLQLSKAVTNSAWTHENGNPRHSAGHLQGSFPLEPLWSTSIGKGASRTGRITSGPIVSGDMVYTMDAAAQLSALGLDGTPIWTRDLTLRGEDAGDGFGGGVAIGDGVLVAATGFGEVIAMDPETGKISWRQKLDAPVRAAPTVEGGAAFVVSRNDQAFAIELENGRIRWRIAGVDPDAAVVGGASPAAIDGTVILPFASGEVVGSLARNGRRTWTSIISGGRRGHVRARLTDITGDPVVYNGTIYVANQSGRLVALDRRSGERQWSINEGSLGPALPVGNSLFFVSDEAKLKRLDRATGDEIWSVSLPLYEDPEKRANSYIHTGPVLFGGRLLVVSGDGVIRSFDPTTGEELGTTALGGGGPAAQPAIAKGQVFVLSRDGTLFAFK